MGQKNEEEETLQRKSSRNLHKGPFESLAEYQSAKSQENYKRTVNKQATTGKSAAAY